MNGVLKWAVLLSIAVTSEANAQTPADTITSAPTAIAVRRAGELHIDGRLDDPAWTAASPITEFTQRTPNEAAAPTQRTEVRVLNDDEAIYIGARMFDTEGAAGVRSRLVRRDGEANSDLLRVHLDAYRDRLHYTEFTVNPAGVRGDVLDGDASWDPVWQARATVDSLGWTAELRIPLSQLHFSRDSVQTWGLQITREVQRLNETALWSFVPLDREVLPAYYGALAGLRFARQPSHLELMPYASTRMRRLNSADPRSPFYQETDVDVRAGADLRYQVTPNLTLAATVNPDFGQVEVDPAVVNLSAFETFFSEKRPFFVEGASLFSFGSPGCTMNCGFGLFPFYTRRVGRAPQAVGLAFAAGGEFVDVPSTTNILAAGKLTGRTNHGTSVGVMNAVVGEQHARVAGADGIIDRVLIQPLGNYFVGRVNQELRGGNLLIGAIATSVDRHLSTPGIRSLLPGSARLLGIDTELFWDEHNYRAYAAVIGSHVAGDSLAILRLQTSSARYFQRPDREPGSNGLFSSAFDPGLQALRGYGAIARIVKQGGAWRWDLNASTISPGFESNDLGFLQLADQHWLNGSLQRRFTTPTRYYRSLIAIVGADQTSNYDGDIVGRSATAVLAVTMLNYWNAQLVFQSAASHLDERLTRGGPAVMRPGNHVYLVGSLSTDPRRRVHGSVNGVRVLDVEGGFYNSVSLSARVRLASNATLSVGPSFSRGLTTDQYVTTIRDSTALNFFGRRYVFAHLRQDVASMTVRANVTFTPDLSLEVYAQPLIVSADYSNFQEFEAPRGMRKLISGRDVGIITEADGGYRIDPDASGPAAAFDVANPNFNFRSLRGTAVLRWEWRPGSTMFLAWTQERDGAELVGDFDFTRDRRALLAEQPDNVFVLKVSYWLSR